MSSTPWVLVTGGCGYIGNHTLVLLLQKGYNAVVVDNLSNSSVISLDRVCEIVGLTPEQRKERLVFYEIDICDEVAFRKVFESSPTFQCCIHFAGLKAVGESTKIPLKYYQNNLVGTFRLLNLMDEFNCHSLVFSSSATVYGDPKSCPINETAQVGEGITNAYGRTKYMIEEILGDFYDSKVLAASGADGAAANDWSIVILRYFNPVGSHPSGLIGEDPHGIPNNLTPYIAQVAVGRREFLTVFGNDYPTTVDGTGVRDYLHVMDLASGHLAAMDYMQDKKMNQVHSGKYIFNLGTGNGISVLEMVAAMEKACGHAIAYKVGPRRPGDIAVCYADASLAKQEMNWTATHTLDDMCRDLWAWQSKNPNGFASASK